MFVMSLKELCHDMSTWKFKTFSNQPQMVTNGDVVCLQVRTHYVGRQVRASSADRDHVSKTRTLILPRSSWNESTSLNSFRQIEELTAWARHVRWLSIRRTIDRPELMSQPHLPTFLIKKLEILIRFPLLKIHLYPDTAPLRACIYFSLCLWHH